MKQYLDSQFSHPRGIVGWLAGQVMAYENRERITWAIEQLDIQPDDFLLEIGVGPGLGIERAAGKAYNGLAAGIDLSETMIGQARRRNARGIGEGHIELRQADVSNLPYEENSFDKVFAINSLHHWPDPASGLRECRRVLKAGGLVAIIEQPHGVQSEAAIRRRGDELVRQLLPAGFLEATGIGENLQRGPVVFVTGVK